MLELIKQNPFYVFLAIYFANLILDYPLQSEFLADYKSKNNYVLFVHSAIWGIGIFLVLISLGLGTIWKLPMLVIGHMLIDAWKCRGWYKKLNIKDWHSLYIDQGLHLIQLIVCIIL